MIVTIIGKIIDIISGLVFKLLKFFNLQLLFISALLGLILYLFGALEIPWVKTALYILVGFSVFYAIVVTVTAPFRRKKDKDGRGNKSKRFFSGKDNGGKKAETLETVDTAGQNPAPERKSDAPRADTRPQTDNGRQTDYRAPFEIKEEIAEDKPIFYTVRQNPEYVMAEYRDKVELYRKTPDGLVYIRTDEKKEG